MDIVRPPTAVERISGSLTTDVLLTAIASAAGGVAAPLVPVLAKSLAAGRQRDRVEHALGDISRVLSEHEDQLRELGDEQYKLINECILAVLHTTQQEKLALLRRVVANAIDTKDLVAGDGTVLGRLIRDITPSEVDFLVRSFQFSGGIRIVDRTEPELDGPNGLRIPRASPSAVAVGGLMSLGVLVPQEADWGGTGSMMFSPTAGKLLALISDA